MNNIAIQLITMFGIGRISKMPGTIASFVTCIFYFLCIIFGVHIKFLLIAFLVILVSSIIFINKYSSNFTEIDAKEIVIDEFLGQSLPIFLLYHPLQKGDPVEGALVYLVMCFILFRFFDILKPFPINLVDKKMKNGFGVVLDDLLAGVYVLIAIALFGHFFGPPFE
jgi:phosphatidylglycerophosphatase A